MGTKLAEGVIVKGRYRLETLLGEGGYGTVWKATQLNVNRPVAIKFLKAFAADEAAVRRFEREARALGRLQHPNCVTMLDYGRSEMGAYLVTEFLDGERLDHWAEGDHDFTEIMTVAHQVLAALEHAHGERIIHRDLKPANIVVSRNDANELVVKVLDFGIASVVGAKRGDITKTGEVFGTPGYMAPEQLLGENNVGPGADLYAFGVLLYQLIEGRKVFTAGSGIEVALKHLTHDPPPMEKPVPDGLKEIITRLLAKQASDRFHSAEELARALSRAGSAEHPMQAAGGVAPPAGIRGAPSDPRTPPTRPTGLGRNVDGSGAGPMGYGPSGYVRGTTSGARLRPAPPEQAGNSTLVQILLGLLVLLAAVATILFVKLYSSDPEAPLPVAGTRDSSKLLRGNRVAVTPLEPAAKQQVRLEARDAGLTPAEPELPPQSSGCGGRAYRAGFQEISVMVGTLERRPVKVYIPAGYDPDEPHQTMIAAHDTGQAAHELFKELHFGPLADRDDVVIIFPETLNPLHTWKDPDEYMLGRWDLLAARKELCLDNRDVLLLGFGSGGHVAQKLACHLRHVGAIAQSTYRRLKDDEVCKHGDVPYIFLAPNEDGRDPAEGGAGCMGGDAVYSIDSHVDFYRDMYGCEGAELNTARYGESICYTWACNVPFEACEIAGGRPLPRRPTTRVAECEGKAAKFPYRDTMWNFLIANTRSDGPDK